MKKNILYLHETSEVAGAENSLINLVAHMDRQEFNPIFLLPQAGALVDSLKELGVDVILMPFPQLRRLFGVGAAVGHIRRVITERNINLLHSNSIRTHLYASWAGRYAKKPVIWHERNLITFELFDPDRLFYFLPDILICNSSAIARRFEYRGRLAAKVRVIHNGVDTKLFHPEVDSAVIRKEFRIDSDAIVIGIASRFSPDKGHKIFLQAANIILRKNPELRHKVRFLVVGGAVFADNMHRESYLRKLAGGLGVAQRVIFTDVRRDMPQAYVAMDIMVLASLAEPFGRVTLEAMACSRPVVGTRSGGTPEIVEDGVTGFLVEPNNPQEMAEALLRLIRDASLRVSMGLEGRRRVVQYFNIEENVRRTQNIYRELT